MIFLAYASFISRATFCRKSRSGAKRAAILDSIADALFYKPVRFPGFLARVALLVIVAVLSYFAGAYAGMVVVKAPLPAMLFVGAALASWAQSDPD